MTIEKISGAWDLVEWIVKDEKGHITYPFGKEVKGRFCITDGYLAVSIMAKDRLVELSQGITTKAIQEGKGVFLSIRMKVNGHSHHRERFSKGANFLTRTL